MAARSKAAWEEDFSITSRAWARDLCLSSGFILWCIFLQRRYIYFFVHWLNCQLLVSSNKASEAHFQCLPGGKYPLIYEKIGRSQPRTYQQGTPLPAHVSVLIRVPPCRHRRRQSGSTLDRLYDHLSTQACGLPRLAEASGIQHMSQNVLNRTVCGRTSRAGNLRVKREDILVCFNPSQLSCPLT